MTVAAAASPQRRRRLPRLGQALFAPPSVKGWDGGPTWLNGQTLLFRQNLALALTSTEDTRFGRRCDPAALLAKHNKTADADAVDFGAGITGGCGQRVGVDVVDLPHPRRSIDIDQFLTHRQDR